MLKMAEKKTNVIRIKIVEIMALFHVFLDHPSYCLILANPNIHQNTGKFMYFLNQA